MSRGVVLTLLGGTFWGLSGTCGQYLMQSKGIPTNWLVPVRLLTASILILLVLLARERQKIFDIFRQKHNILQLAIFAVLGMAGCQYTYFVTVAHANAGTATVLQYLGPSVILIYLCVRNKKLPCRRETIGVSLSILGTVLLATHGNLHALAISKVALVFGLLSALTQAVYTIQPARLLLHFSTFTVIGWGMLLGGAFLALLLQPWKYAVQLDAQALAALAVVVVLGTIIAFCCFMEGVKHLGPTTGSLLACVEPVSALVFSAVFFHTKFVLLDFIGFGCILGTIVLLSLPDKSAAQSCKNAAENT